MELVKRLSNRQFIDGEWVDSSNKNTRDIINPYNQEVIFTVAEGTKRRCRTCYFSGKTII